MTQQKLVLVLVMNKIFNKILDVYLFRTSKIYYINKSLKLKFCFVVWFYTLLVVVLCYLNFKN